MESESGRQMGTALQAVLRMHSDSVKLLRDLDKHLDGYHPLLGNYVTLDMGSSINRQVFMAEGLLRHYSRDKRWGKVLGINICYFDFAKPERLPEPILIVSALSYLNQDADAQEKTKRPWDPWYAFLEWVPARRFRERIDLEGPFRSSSLERLSMAAAPLFLIDKLSAAVELIDLVGRP